jgi:hypothetical protein
MTKCLKIFISEHIGVKPKIKKEHPEYMMPVFRMVEREIVFDSRGNSPNPLTNKLFFSQVEECFAL